MVHHYTISLLELDQYAQEFQAYHAELSHKLEERAEESNIHYCSSVS
jgi:hypothetical protein